MIAVIFTNHHNIKFYLKEPDDDIILIYADIMHIHGLYTDIHTWMYILST